jgi:Domain of unknown function (DUF4157)
MTAQAMDQVKSVKPQSVMPARGVVLQRKCACGGTPGPTGECADCQKKRMALQASNLLSLGQPSDRYEIEANHIANTVTGSVSTPSVSRVSVTQLQRYADVSTTQDAAPSSVYNELKTSGQPLESSVKGMMEKRFGHGFDQVRIHTGPSATTSAKAVNARAYTVGSHIVFGDREYVPESIRGQRLLAHELTHVLQQGQASGVVQRELIYGSGYPRPYANDAAEVIDAEQGTWFPSSVDMSATTRNSGGGSGKATFKALLSSIETRAVGSITQLGIIGHSSSTDFGLSGTIGGGNVAFTNGGLINTTSLAREASTIANLRNRFATGAKIVLFGCHAGAGRPLLDAISQAFGVCVKGFTGEITWCFTWNSVTKAIQTRGKVWVVNPNDPLPVRPGCSQFGQDINTLTPDQESCVGVVPNAPAPTPAPVPAPRTTEPSRSNL